MTGQNSLSLEPRPYSTTSTVIPPFEYLSIKCEICPNIQQRHEKSYRNQ